MSSAISCIVIKSDRLPKRIPTLGEIVRVSGEAGLFVVMNVDEESRVAQLMEKSGNHRLHDVPFAAVKTFNQSLARTVNRFLDFGDTARTRNR